LVFFPQNGQDCNRTEPSNSVAAEICEDFFQEVRVWMDRK
jgi:hypothetical protein